MRPLFFCFCRTEYIIQLVVYIVLQSQAVLFANLITTFIEAPEHATGAVVNINEIKRMGF